MSLRIALRNFRGRNIAMLCAGRDAQQATLVSQTFERKLITVSAKMEAPFSEQSTTGTSSYEKEDFLREAIKNEPLRNTMAYSLSFATPGSDVDSSAFMNLLDARMRQQLAASSSQLQQHKRGNSKLQGGKESMENESGIDNTPLPRTLEEALRPSRRAIVVTDTTRPFRVVDVNKAWEGLCGYSYIESHGKTLGSLLRGPETDASAVTALVSQLMRGEEAGAVLTNYTKEGRKFRNRLRVGPLMEAGEITHFVGVLQELH